MDRLVQLSSRVWFGSPFQTLTGLETTYKGSRIISIEPLLYSNLPLHLFQESQSFSAAVIKSIRKTETINISASQQRSQPYKNIHFRFILRIKTIIAFKLCSQFNLNLQFIFNSIPTFLPTQKILCYIIYTK